MSDQEFEDIIRVIEGVHCAKGPKGCRKCQEQGIDKRLCLIRIFKEADETPRPVIELDNDGETEYYVYDVLKCFDNVQQAHDYAEEHEIINVEY